MSRQNQDNRHNNSQDNRHDNRHDNKHDNSQDNRHDYKHDNSFKYDLKRNSTELPNFIWGKQKENINVDLDWSVLDKAKDYSPTSKKFILCLTEK